MTKLPLENGLTGKNTTGNYSNNYEKLYSEIFEETSLEKLREVLPSDYIETIECILDNTELNQYHVKILRMRFGLTKDKVCLTMKQIGKELNISSTRVGQILRTIFRQLRRTWRNKVLAIGISCYSKENYCDLVIHKTDLIKENLSESEKEVDEVSRKGQQIDSLLNESIDMLGLYYRPYCSLKRSGNCTIKDVLNLTENDMLKIRDLGIASMGNIQMQLDWYLQNYLHMSLLDYHNMVHRDDAEQYCSKYKKKSF